MTMTLKPWRQIAIPRQDVLRGETLMSEFAADLTKVHRGTAPSEYLDPREFFQRTYLTYGMQMLLRSVAERLAGLGGEPVMQLQTAFGGGKTHSLLAVYHLAQGQIPATEMQGVSAILDGQVDVSAIKDASNVVKLSNQRIMELPQARVVVIDGNNFGPSQPVKRGTIQVHTLWGELAWQLGGQEAYEELRESDENGTAPGKEKLTALLSRYAPCVILMDELVAYYRQFEEGKRLSGGTYESNISFIQQLTEALSAVPTAMLLASLPESEREAGGVRGQVSLEALSYYLNRVQALWKPVTSKESFQIVRRRMFEEIRDQHAADQVCQAFTELYIQNGGEFPGETQMSDYLTRMREEYPIHPEVFDRLYEDWSSLENFQRTRGVLKFMAKAIHALWTQGNQDALIMPGNLPFDDAQTRNDLIYYLPPGWDPVVERDVEQEAARIENEEPRLGSVQAPRRATHTIFLGSAPGAVKHGIRGIDLQHILLGVAVPGQGLSVYSDALRKLRDRLHYLNTSGDGKDERYWFDVRPNLRKEMEERKKRFTDSEHIHPEVQRRLSSVLPRGGFGGVHSGQDSANIPDDGSLRLVVLGMDAPHHPTVAANDKAVGRAGTVLRQRGNVPRQFQNRLIFLAPDANETGRLRDHALSYLAWKSINDDVSEMRLNLDVMQSKQARDQMDKSEKILLQAVRDTYKFLLVPGQQARMGRVNDTQWETHKLNTGQGQITPEVERVLKDNELVISEWAAFHLHRELKQWFWINGKETVGARDVWKQFGQQLYLPRLKDESVFKVTLQQGSGSEDFFGLAQGQQDDKYRGFSFGKASLVVVDDSLLLIEPGAALEYRKGLTPPPPPPEDDEEEDDGKRKPEPTPPPPPPPPEKVKKEYHASVELDPVTATMQFNDVMLEVVQHFKTSPGVRLLISVEIHAESPEGFAENVQRTVRENARQLQFKTSEFE